MNTRAFGIYLLQKARFPAPLNLNPRYDGHIILGTRRDLSPRESNFLAAQHVTTVAVDLAECEGSAAPSNG